ncbi:MULTISPECIES: universal stress protein [Altibacter]|uniref:universal stress protein n=1 Tax=Altibacter TaxID=1535231 RepID=UPI0005535B19|nr:MULTISPECIES: universal stress protein [Altibacter]MCW8981312.1 universal stress protein [Altibacter sp.]MCW9036681.1 universal stress protein [Altibacter sp.]
MKKILVPVDFSEYSDYALEAAASIAKSQDAEIIALHMMGLSEAVINKDESKEVFEAMYYLKLAQKRFEEFLDKKYLTDVKVTDTVYNYKNFNEINDVAKEHGADLIVMGSHGTSGFTEVFVGSNTEKVVRTSEIPVLVIKGNPKQFLLENVVFACDFEKESIRAYQKAMKLFRQFNTNVYLLHVNLPNERFRSTSEIEEKVREFLYQADLGNLDSLDNVVYVADYSVEDGVFSYSNKINADAIALATHGRKGLAHFFFGSVGEDLANHSDIPVLTFKI